MVATGRGLPDPARWPGVPTSFKASWLGHINDIMTLLFCLLNTASVAGVEALDTRSPIEIGSSSLIGAPGQLIDLIKLSKTSRWPIQPARGPCGGGQADMAVQIACIGLSGKGHTG